MKTLWMRFIMILFISSALASCVVKTTNRRLGSRPLNIQDIRVAEGSDKTIVEVEGEGLMLFTTFRLSSPDRLVLEISEVGLGKYQDEITMSEGPILSIKPVASGDVHVSRLEFQLSPDVRTDVRPEGLNIVIEVTQTGSNRLAGARTEATGNNFHFFEEKTPGNNQDLSAAEITTKKIPEGTLELKMPGQETSAGLVETLPPPLLPPLRAKQPGVVDTSSHKTEKQLALSAATKVLSLQLIEGADLKLLISLDGQSSPKVFYSDGTKKHIVVDLPGVMKNMQGKRIAGDGRVVQKVRTGIHPNKLRLVIDLLLPVTYTLIENQDKVEIILKENK